MTFKFKVRFKTKRGTNGCDGCVAKGQGNQTCANTRGGAQLDGLRSCQDHAVVYKVRKVESCPG